MSGSAIRYSLGDMAVRFGLELHGDPQTRIEGVCTLVPGRPGCLGFLAHPRYRAQLGASLASAIVVGKRDAENLPGAGLVAPDPNLAFARIAALFDTSRLFEPGVHPSATVSESAAIGEDVCIAAGVVVEDGAVIGAGSYIGPVSVIGREARIGEGSYLVAQVHVGARVRLGMRCHVQPGAVIGSRGFGNVRGPHGWEEIPQLGTVVVGDDVEIGAGTCIDRGALDDTVIGNGVRLDNLIQIAHNCTIGEHTAIAACTGIAGSTRVGARCMIGGAVGISGHLTIGDDVVILAMAMVTKPLPLKGVYGSGVPVAAARDWRKQIARMRRLENTEARLMELELRLGIEARPMDEHDEDGDDGQR
ncbi:MAG: UDP-3-O-(3-hydroxymyristoyl)glucosamine N-acyltransferase [Panacagrimonas sp.]